MLCSKEQHVDGGGVQSCPVGTGPGLQGGGKLQGFREEGRSDSFLAQLQLRDAARRAFVETDTSKRLRRAMISKPSRAIEYVVGDKVFYWRQGQGAHPSRGCWYGPAKVIEVEGGLKWLAHGIRVLKAHAAQLRPATSMENAISCDPAVEKLAPEHVRRGN